MRRSGIHLAAFAALALSLIGAAVGARAASPSLSNILPRGAARGSEVEARFLGNNLGDAVDLLFHTEGIALKEITEKKGNEVRCVLSIAPDCRLGRHAVRVRTASGMTNLAIFSVGALTEVSEAEPNNSPENAQAIELGTTVNGVVQNEDVDYVAVELAEGDRLAVEVEAIRLGHALFDAKLRLFSPKGHEVISEDDTALMRQDAAFVYTAEDAGRHLVAVSEASYGGSGNYEYRLHVGRFPRPLAAVPLGGKPGEKVHVSWLGDAGLAESDIVLADAGGGMAEVLPASDLGMAPTPLAFRAVDLPSAIEAEPNDGPDAATAGAGPGAFNGVIEKPGDVDWFAFDGKKDQNLEFRVWARALGSPLDSVLSVSGPDGKQIAHSDDSAGLDSAARVKLPADGRYTLSVRDHLGHGGPTFAYRVEATPVTAELSLSAAENEAAVVSVARGNRTLLLLNASRQRFNDAVNVEFTNLPEGVAADHGVFDPGETRIPVVISAAADAAPGGTLLDIRGTSANGISGGFEQTIPLVYGRNKTVFDAYEARRLALAVTEEAPFSIELVPPKAPLVHNSAVNLKVIAHRKEGFDGPIRLRAPWTPKGCGLPQQTIAKGESETTIRLEVRGDAPKGEVKLVLVGDSAGYEVCTPFTPVTIEEPWLALDLQPTQAEQGQEMQWSGKVTVAKPFEGTYMLEMYRLPKGISTEQQLITAETTEVVFPVKLTEEAPEGKHRVGFRTTLAVNGETIDQGLGGTELKVFKPLPPKLKQPPPKPEKKEAEKKEPEKKRRTRFPNTN